MQNKNFDVLSYAKWPSCDLSNFAHHSFLFDGIQCNSMEGLLTSFKFKDVAVQREVCLLYGKAAHNRGKGIRWRNDHMLYWNGKSYDRFGDEYQELLDRAYLSLALNDNFSKALLITGNDILIHSIGSNNQMLTILTNNEFCGRLMAIRTLLIEGI